MYPNLAKAYPANKLPDLRGEFIRGWDDERGIDPGRQLLEWQKGTPTGSAEPSPKPTFLCRSYDVIKCNITRTS
ncbi:TPA: hypothetical protein ACIT12_004648 [Salmonella enterica subsp. enterica serovar Typhi]